MSIHVWHNAVQSITWQFIVTCSYIYVVYVLGLYTRQDFPFLWTNLPDKSHFAEDCCQVEYSVVLHYPVML